MLNNLEDLDNFINIYDIYLTTLIYTNINNRKIINNNINGVFLPENIYIDDNTNYDNIIKNEIRKHKLSKILNGNSDECNDKKSYDNIKKIIIDCDKLLPLSKRSFVDHYLKIDSKYNLVILLRVSQDDRPYYSKMPKKLLYMSSLVASLDGDNFKVIKNRYG